MHLLLASSDGRFELRAGYLVGSAGSTVRWLAGVGAERGYRRGRILFAGEACHSNRPPGARRLRLGLPDALNLAWKLAAPVQDWAPAGLLAANW